MTCIMIDFQGGPDIWTWIIFLYQIHRSLSFSLITYLLKGMMYILSSNIISWRASKIGGSMWSWKFLSLRFGSSGKEVGGSCGKSQVWVLSLLNVLTNQKKKKRRKRHWNLFKSKLMRFGLTLYYFPNLLCKSKRVNHGCFAYILFISPRVGMGCALGTVLKHDAHFDSKS